MEVISANGNEWFTFLSNQSILWVSIWLPVKVWLIKSINFVIVLVLKLAANNDQELFSINVTIENSRKFSWAYRKL